MRRGRPQCLSDAGPHHVSQAGRPQQGRLEWTSLCLVDSSSPSAAAADAAASTAAAAAAAAAAASAARAVACGSRLIEPQKKQFKLLCSKCGATYTAAAAAAHAKLFGGDSCFPACLDLAAAASAAAATGYATQELSVPGSCGGASHQ